MNRKQLIAHQTERARDALKGRTIADAFYEDGDDDCHLILMLDDLTAVYVMADDEGNGPGALHLYGPSGRKAPVLPAIK
jgi:hypothetical protein